MEPVAAALALIVLLMILVALSLNVIERVMQENIELEHQIDKQEQISQDQQMADEDAEEGEKAEEAEEAEEGETAEADTDVEAEAPDSDDSYMSLTKEEEKIVSQNANKFFSYTIGELLKIRLERERRAKEE